MTVKVVHNDSFSINTDFRQLFSCTGNRVFTTPFAARSQDTREFIFLRINKYYVHFVQSPYSSFGFLERALLVWDPTDLKTQLLREEAKDTTYY